MNRKEFFFLITTTCIVIIVWVISDIYHTKANTPVSPTLQQALEPLTPNFDQQTLDKIKKINNTPIQASDNSSSPNPNPTLTPQPSPTITPPPISASPSASIQGL